MLSIGTARHEYKVYLAKAISDGVITSDEEAVLHNLCESIVKRRLTAYRSSK